MIAIPTDAADTDDVKLDPACAEAVELAVAAARETAGGAVGAHLGVRAEAERVVTHFIEAVLPGYQGWHWAVTIARASGFAPTVDEVVLLPGADAVLAQPWVPWSERLQPGDLGPGDLLPAIENDPRLVPAYLALPDSEADDIAFELGLGRERVLSRDGRLDAADRWISGDNGPDTPMARLAPAHCGTCAFLVPLSGSLRAAFGVCANEITASDGRVVSVEFGCGAHSEAGVLVDLDQLVENGTVYDDDMIDMEPGSARPDLAESAGTEPPSIEPPSIEPPSIESAGIESAGIESITLDWVGGDQQVVDEQLVDEQLSREELAGNEVVVRQVVESEPASHGFVELGSLESAERESGELGVAEILPTEHRPAGGHPDRSSDDVSVPTEIPPSWGILEDLGVDLSDGSDPLPADPSDGAGQPTAG